MCFVHVHGIYFIKKEWLFEKKEVSLHLRKETIGLVKMGRIVLTPLNI